MRISWTESRSNQLILKEISSEYSLEELVLKLKLNYFAHLMQISNSSGKVLMMEKIEGRKRRGQKRKIKLDDITDSLEMSLSRLWDIVKDREGCRAAIHRITSSLT